MKKEFAASIVLAGFTIACIAVFDVVFESDKELWIFIMGSMFGCLYIAVVEILSKIWGIKK